MRDLSHILERTYAQCLYSYSADNSAAPTEGKSLYMTIPLEDNHIEIPAFAVCGMRRDLHSEALVVILGSTGSKAPYKSLSCNIRYGLEREYTSFHLMSITPDNDENPYYATWGAIFNKDYIPVMMLTWELEKEPLPDNTDFQYKFTRPVLRLAPEVFRKSNAVEKYIVNKVIPEILTLNGLNFPFREDLHGFYKHHYGEVVPDVKIIVEYCPFRLSSVDMPSISTTNKDLLNIALDNLDEVIA